MRASLARLVAQLRTAGRMVDATMVAVPVERAALWQVRENGAGLLTRPDPTTQTRAGWEDAAVAPERLAGYLRDFRALLDRHGLLGVLYGHFGAGCVHVRIDFDLATPAGAERMRRFLREAARLVVEHGGSLSVEHGTAVTAASCCRSCTRRRSCNFGLFKRIFDPSGLFNPGVIVDPAPVHDSL